MPAGEPQRHASRSRSLQQGSNLSGRLDRRPGRRTNPGNLIQSAVIRAGREGVAKGDDRSDLSYPVDRVAWPRRFRSPWLLAAFAGSAPQ